MRFETLHGPMVTRFETLYLTWRNVGMGEWDGWRRNKLSTSNWTSSRVGVYSRRQSS